MVRLANGTDLKKYNEKISKPQSLICYSHSPIQYGLTPLKGLYFNKIVEPSAASFCGEYQSCDDSDCSGLYAAVGGSLQFYQYLHGYRSKAGT